MNGKQKLTLAHAFVIAALEHIKSLGEAQCQEEIEALRYYLQKIDSLLSDW